MHAIVARSASEAHVIGLLAALRARGESVDEIVGAAEALRELAVPLPRAPATAIDTCGTGGGGVRTFNVSTLAALVVAGAGVPVAKHGNRKATSACGSADLLEALGVSLDLPPARMAASVSEIGIGFLFARVCHPAFGAVAGVRTALGIPTLFNRLGPLLHPMSVRRQLVGVASPGHLEDTLEGLIRLGAERVGVVHGEEGMDEISISGRTQVLAWADGRRESFAIEPGAHVPRATLADVCGGAVEENAAIARQVLGGARGPARDIVVLNAAAALCVAAAAPDLDGGVRLAQRSLDEGKAQAILERWVAFTRDALVVPAAGAA
jgi:anthranilate phosphoribosyltransferase